MVKACCKNEGSLVTLTVQAHWEFKCCFLLVILSLGDSVKVKGFALVNQTFNLALILT
jgi:hypothetical protein